MVRLDPARQVATAGSRVATRVEQCSHATYAWARHTKHARGGPSTVSGKNRLLFPSTNQAQAVPGNHVLGAVFVTSLRGHHTA